jgi:hypothetical protein
MISAHPSCIHRCLDDAGYDGPRLLHGAGEACWPLVAHAGRLGLATRIGLEDTLVLPDGQRAVSNARLVTEGLVQYGDGRRAWRR